MTVVFLIWQGPWGTTVIVLHYGEGSDDAVFFFLGIHQDAFDHDKGQKSAVSGRRLHLRLSTGFFLLFLQFLCAI